MDNAINRLKNQFQALLQSNRLSHAHLLECPLSKPVDDAVNGIVPLMLCASKSNCGSCQSCMVLATKTHPDFVQLTNSNQPIKVSDIRELTLGIYQAPKIAKHRIIVINAVDCLNRASANALLKILEEPPKHVVFILSCHNISRVIATIRSRTVLWRLPVSLASEKDWQQFENWLGNDEAKYQLLTEKNTIMKQINSIYDTKMQPSEIAQAWHQYPLYDLLWFLYVLHAWALRQNYNSQSQTGYFGDSKLLMQQLLQINAMIKLAGQGIPLNHILMCETLLMGCRGIAE